MVIRQEKKRRRGERTYHGSHKKWRGGGSRGGRGNAGGHKHKYSFVVKFDPGRFGKRGFKKLQDAGKIRAINLIDLEKQMPDLLEKKIAEKVGSEIKINLQKIGYQKLLGGGKISMPIIVETKLFSKNAAKKIEEAGGKVVKV